MSDLGDFFPNGRFDEVTLLNDAGGMGIILRCRKGAKVTAVKCLRAPLPDPTFLDRFRREIRINQTLKHPNVIQTLEVHDAKPPYWYEMEIAAAGSLKGHIPEILKDTAQIKAVFIQICTGVKYLHDHPRKIVHRDLKPQNILVFSDGLVKITDVGLARYVDRDTMSLTQTGIGWGTPFYLSPEQMADFKSAGLSTDIFALGVILFELFTDTPVMAGYDLDTDIPAPYNAIVRRLTRRNAADRYQSVDELLADLHAKTGVYEKVSDYETPIEEADELVVRANGEGHLSGEELERLIHILADNMVVRNFGWETIDKLEPAVLDELAVNDPEGLHRLMEIYIASTGDTMKNRFPFGWMDGWTDFLQAAYRKSSLVKTKTIALRGMVTSPHKTRPV